MATDVRSWLRVLGVVALSPLLAVPGLASIPRPSIERPGAPTVESSALREELAVTWLADMPSTEGLGDVFRPREDLASAAGPPPSENSHPGVGLFLAAYRQEREVRKWLSASGLEASEANDRIGNTYVHLYYYALGNPLRYVDRDGHQADEVEELAKLRGNVAKRASEHPAVQRRLADFRKQGVLLGRMNRTQLEALRDAPVEAFADAEGLTERHRAVVATEAETPLWDRATAFGYERYGLGGFVQMAEGSTTITDAIENKPALTEFDEAAPEYYEQARRENLAEFRQGTADIEAGGATAARGTAQLADDVSLAAAPLGIVRRGVTKKALKEIGEAEIDEVFEAAGRTGVREDIAVEFAEHGIPVRRGVAQQQGREFRRDWLEVNEFDPKQPAHVRGYLRNQRRRVEAGRADAPRTPQGSVLAHGKATPAREGFDYSNTQRSDVGLNQLEEKARRLLKKRVQE